MTDNFDDSLQKLSFKKASCDYPNTAKVGIEKRCGRKANGQYAYKGYVLNLCKKHRDIVDGYEIIDATLKEKIIIQLGNKAI